MPYQVEVTVVTIRADFDPWGGEYTYVEFAWKLPLPTPQGLTGQPGILGAEPKNVEYKHVMHLIIPRENWVDQYRMWERRTLLINDDGSIEFKKTEET